MLFKTICVKSLSESKLMKRKYYKYRPQIQTDNFQREDILKIVLRPNIYKSVNHFIECAVIALLDKEDKNWRTER